MVRRSERILRKNNIKKEISDEERTAIENNILLKHIIDNDLKHLWRFIWGILILLIGLIFKSFLP